MIISILAILFTFTLVVIFHEFGHFLVARRFGVRVEKFSLGIGPEMLAVERGGTRYCLSWFPIGGFVKMAGESAEEPGTGAPDEFMAQAWWRRFLIVAAGPGASLVLAALLFSAVAGVWGVPVAEQAPVIGQVIAGGPAAAAGLAAGDRIVSVDGHPVSAWAEAADHIHRNPGRNVKMMVERGMTRLQLVVTPRFDARQRHGLIGIAPVVHMERHGPLHAVWTGLKTTWFWSVTTMKFLGLMVLRLVRAEVAGPLGIGQLVAQAAHTGIQDLLYTIGLISTSLGLFNLFPIPVLDGGHLYFFAWEGVVGRPVQGRTIRVAQTIGLGLLISILVFATYSDVERWRSAIPH